MDYLPTEPKPPDAWLASYNSDRMRRGVGIYSSLNDLNLLDLIAKTTDEKTKGAVADLVVTKDDPSLSVAHNAIQLDRPECLSARDNWFIRHADVLERHLRDPLRAQVYTFAPGSLSEPLQSQKSSKQGPFPWPIGTSKPICRICNSPLAYVGVLDYRQFTSFHVPHGSLVFHGCETCGVFDERSYSLMWISESSLVGFQNSGRDSPILIGTRWMATDYPPIGVVPGQVTDRGSFLLEYSFFLNVTCFGNKVGGHIFWIQNDDTPLDCSGRPMNFIGQFLGVPGVGCGDDGISYIFFSEDTGETKIKCQFF